MSVFLALPVPMLSMNFGHELRRNILLPKITIVLDNPTAELQHSIVHRLHQPKMWRLGELGSNLNHLHSFLAIGMHFELAVFVEVRHHESQDLLEKSCDYPRTQRCYER